MFIVKYCVYVCMHAWTMVMLLFIHRYLTTWIQFPSCYETLKFITVFTRTRDWSLPLLSLPNNSSKPKALCDISQHADFLRWEVVGLSLNAPPPQDGDPPLIGCLRLLIKYISSYPPYLEAASSIRNLRKCHAVVTRHPHTMYWYLVKLSIKSSQKRSYRVTVVWE